MNRIEADEFRVNVRRFSIKFLLFRSFLPDMTYVRIVLRDSRPSRRCLSSYFLSLLGVSVHKSVAKTKLPPKGNVSFASVFTTLIRDKRAQHMR